MPYPSIVNVNTFNIYYSGEAHASPLFKDFNYSNFCHRHEAHNMIICSLKFMYLQIFIHGYYYPFIFTLNKTNVNTKMYSHLFVISF